MNKLFFGFIAVVMMISNVNGATLSSCQQTAEQCSEMPGMVTVSSSCKTACCSDGITTSNGVITTKKTTMSQIVCPPAGYGQMDCRCSDSSTYVCDVGYYGTGTSSTTGCTLCPKNATCAGGNCSIFVCKAGYFKSGNGCSKCSTSTENDYANSVEGATSITQCFLPSWVTMTNEKGTFYYSSQCYYK